jgi:hypothetical protein
VQDRPGAVHLGTQGLTVEQAIDYLVDAAQGVVESQLELARLDLELAAARMMQGVMRLAVGALLLGGAGVALAMAAYEALPPSMTPVERLLVIGGSCVVLGLGLVLGGMRRLRRNHGPR